MIEVITKTKIEAIQIKGKNILKIKGISMSKRWTPTGSHHDRFMEEPEKPSMMYINSSGKKSYIRNRDGEYLIRYTKPDAKVYFAILPELIYLKEFKEK